MEGQFYTFFEAKWVAVITWNREQRGHREGFWLPPSKTGYSTKALLDAGGAGPVLNTPLNPCSANEISVRNKTEMMCLNSRRLH